MIDLHGQTEKLIYRWDIKEPAFKVGSERGTQSLVCDSRR